MKYISIYPNNEKCKKLKCNPEKTRSKYSNYAFYTKVTYNYNKTICYTRFYRKEN